MSGCGETTAESISVRDIVSDGTGASGGLLSGTAASIEVAGGGTPATLLGTLGRDELLHVAGFLGQSDLKALAATCTRLLQLAYDPQVPGKPWSSIDMKFWPFIVCVEPDGDSSWSRIRLLMAGNNFGRSASHRRIIGGNIPTDVPCCRFPASTLAQTGLRRLRVQDANAEDIQAAVHRVAGHLEVFRCHTMATDEYFGPLASCHKLRVLCLETSGRSQSTAWGDTGLAQLRSIRNLEQLYLAGFPGMTIQGLQPLLRPGLRILDLGKLNSRHIQMQQVLHALAESCPHLEELDLGGLYPLRGEDVPVSEEIEGLVALVKSIGNSLRRLNLGHGIDTSDKVLAAIMAFIPSGQLELFSGARFYPKIAGARIHQDVHVAQIVSYLQNSPYVAEVQNNIGQDTQQAWEEAMGSEGWDLNSRMWTAFITHFHTAQLLHVDNSYAAYSGFQYLHLGITSVPDAFSYPSRSRIR